MPVIRSHGYLGEVFAVAHRARAGPAGDRVGDTGVLVMPPLGYEDTSAYRPLRTLADALAEAGFLVLRIDWPGLGDSGGADLDPDLHGRRCEAARSGAAALRQAGCRRVLGIGVRAGGLLAMAAGGFDDLVLWGVPESGKRYLREERLFQTFAARSFGGVAGPPPLEGSVEAGGFIHGPRVVDALQALQPTSLPHTGLQRALLIGRDGAEPDGALARALRAAGAKVDELHGQGLGSLLENAYHAALAAPVRDAILAWAGPPLQPHAGQLRLSPWLELAEGQGVGERPWITEGGAGTLSGILCEPAGGARPGMAWTVFFNAGGMRRSGPNRLWTHAARALAAAGRPSLRFDVRDVGDSDGRTFEPGGDATDLEAMYAPSSVEDALQAVDWVRGQGAGSIDVTGLCSGAFLGAHVCVRRHVRRAVLFNALAFVWDEEARAWSITGQVRGSLFDARRWRRLLTGKIDPIGLGSAIASDARQRVRRLLARDAGIDPVAALLTEIQRRGTDLQLVSSVGDPSIPYLERHVSLGRRPPVTLLSGADHTIRPAWLHSRVIGLIVG